MAIEKFRFVSPGVQINEIDDSIITPQPPAAGPVVIGNTAKGPAMQPVMVSSVAELERVFGAPSNGNVGAQDVWRTGVSTSPTLATYAAKAFLQNSAPVTVVRLAGVEGTGTAVAGWQTDKVYHLFATSGSDGVLVANIYASSSLELELADGNSGSLSDGSFSLFFNGTEKVVSVDALKKEKFIRNVLNTNPTKYNTSEVAYFLGETFENSTGSVAGFTDVYLSSSTTHSTFKSAEGAVSAESAVVVDDLVDGLTGTYNELFKFVGLNNGAALSKEIKISIENVRASKNTSVTKYGTFDVVIRKLFESQSDSVLERFAGVNLDVTSDNYILKKIGDSHRRWNSSASRYEELGTYSNKSAYIRVEMIDSDASPQSLPHGFKIKGTPDFGTADGFTLVGASLPLFTSTVSLSAAKSKRFGLVSKVDGNADLVDVLAHKASSLSLSSPEELFHTRYIDVTATQVGYSGSAFYNDSYDILLGGVSGSIAGFDLPMYGGFDAKDITMVEPFINNGSSGLGSGGASEYTNAAYRSVKQAIDIVADPETVDMNILCVPGLQIPVLTDYMLEVAKLRGDTLALVDLVGDYRYPYENDNEGVFEANGNGRPSSVLPVIGSLTDRSIDNSYGAAYFPAVFVPAEGIFMPASIAALGAIGGTEGRQALWFAPAGFNRGGLTSGNSGVSVSRTALHLVSSDRDALYEVNINPIATFPNEGVVIFGQKTLQATPSALDRVNVRRLVNFVKKQVSRAATRVLFEPNVEATWNRFKNVVEPFLLAIKNGYGLDDAKIILDETTTTADLVDRNIMYAKLYLKPTRAIEYIAIDLAVTNNGALFNE